LITWKRLYFNQYDYSSVKCALW